MPSAREYLLLRLWGPMASWGSIAVGEQRNTWSRPSKSAVLGLVAAALGYTREQSEAHGRLDAGLGFAVRVDSDGTPLRDYHTAQSPKGRNRTWPTRREELRERGNLATILSERQYLCDMSAVVALWHRAGGEAPPLAEIDAHLRRPRFVPYLGRKACPLGLPLRPWRGEADDIRAAFRGFDEDEKRNAARWDEAAKTARAWPRPSMPGLPEPTGVRRIWLDAREAAAVGVSFDPGSMRTLRRDAVGDRARWLFEEREEVSIEEGGAPC